MASEVCFSITKYFLFLFNLTFFVLGSALLSLGLWIIFSKESFLLPAPPYISLSLFSFLLIIGGSVTMLLSFCGCLGALKEVKCMLAIYFLLLTLLLAAQIIGGVLLFTQRSTFEESLQDHVGKLIGSFGKNDSSLQDFEKTLEFLQQEAKCCGWAGPGDWTIPPCSCLYCVNVTLNATDQICDKNSHNVSMCNAYAVYEKGCKDVITKWLDQHIVIIFGVLLAIIMVECLQWLCLVTFFCLNRASRCCHPRKSHGSHVQLSRDFNVEYWQDMWFDPFDVSI